MQNVEYWMLKLKTWKIWRCELWRRAAWAMNELKSWLTINNWQQNTIVNVQNCRLRIVNCQHEMQNVQTTNVQSQVSTLKSQVSGVSCLSLHVSIITTANCESQIANHTTCSVALISDLWLVKNDKMTTWTMSSVRDALWMMTCDFFFLSTC